MTLETGLLIFSSFVFTLILMALGFTYLKERAGGIPKGQFRVLGFKDHKLIYNEIFTDTYFVVSPGSKFDRVEITPVGDKFGAYENDTIRQREVERRLFKRL